MHHADSAYRAAAVQTHAADDRRKDRLEQTTTGPRPSPGVSDMQRIGEPEERGGGLTPIRVVELDGSFVSLGSLFEVALGFLGKKALTQFFGDGRGLGRAE